MGRLVFGPRGERKATSFGNLEAGYVCAKGEKASSLLWSGVLLDFGRLPLHYADFFCPLVRSPGPDSGKKCFLIRSSGAIPYVEKEFSLSGRRR